eukprot:SAG22_NODE_747_length_7495_cov_7.582342_3_plen_205_part_00
MLGVGTPVSGMRMALLMGFVSNAVCWCLALTLRSSARPAQDDIGKEEARGRKDGGAEPQAAQAQAAQRQSRFGQSLPPAGGDGPPAAQREPGAPLVWTTTEELRREGRPAEWQNLTLAGLEPAAAAQRRAEGGGGSGKKQQQDRAVVVAAAAAAVEAAAAAVEAEEEDGHAPASAGKTGRLSSNPLVVLRWVMTVGPTHLIMLC